MLEIMLEFMSDLCSICKGVYLFMNMYECVFESVKQMTRL